MKLEEDYKLYSHDSCIATTHESPYKRLSKENCDEIFGVVDVNDIRKSVNTGVYLGSTTSNTLMSIATKQSLQQPTEIEVEFEMENYVKYVPKSLETVYPTGGVRPILNENGCLILKKK